MPGSGREAMLAGPAADYKTGGAGLVLRGKRGGEATLSGRHERQHAIQIKSTSSRRSFVFSSKMGGGPLTSAGKQDILRKNFGRKPTGRRKCFRKLRWTSVLKPVPNEKTSRRRAAPQQGSGAPFVFVRGAATGAAKNQPVRGKEAAAWKK